jgi:hypothetical protein
MERDRHGGLAARVRVGDGRLVDDLGDGLVREGACAQLDDRPHAGHGRADGDAAVGQLGDGRVFNPIGVLLTDGIEVLPAGQAAEAGANQGDFRFRRENFVERLGHGLGVG